MNLKFIFTSLLLWIILAGCTETTQEIKKFNSVDDIRQARIGVGLGTTHDQYVSKNMLEAEIIRIETEPDLFMALNQGKCDVIFADYVTYRFAHSEYPNMVEIPSNFPTDHYGVAFNKENIELRDRFNQFLRRIKEDGTLKEIQDRWLLSGDTSTMPQMQNYTEGELLRVGTSAVQFPFTFIKNQEFMGIDIEIARRFADEIKRPIEFQNISFGSLIASLQAGKSDMVLAGMFISEERKKNALFSDPYYDTHTAVITLNSNYAQAIGEDGFWQTLKESFKNNILAEKRYMMILEGLKVTVIISIFSILLGTLLGGLICYMRMSKNFWLRSIASAYISLMRGMPVLVLLMLMFYVFLAKLPINGEQVAILTFALNFSAYVSEMFRTAIQSVDRGQTEAGIALGFSPVKTFYHIVMPQAIKNVMPVYKGEMISLIKTTSIVGYIAVEDLTKMSDIIRSRTFDAFFPLIMVAILYFILAWIFGKALDLLNSKQPGL